MVMVCVCKTQGKCWLWFVSAKTQGKCWLWFVSAKHRASDGNGLCLLKQGKCWLWFVSAKHRAIVGYGLCLLKHRASVVYGLCLLKHRACVGYGLCLQNTGQVLVMVCVCKTQGKCWLLFVPAKHRAGQSALVMVCVCLCGGWGWWWVDGMGGGREGGQGRGGHVYEARAMSIN